MSFFLCRYASAFIIYHEYFIIKLKNAFIAEILFNYIKNRFENHLKLNHTMRLKQNFVILKKKQ